MASGAENTVVHNVSDLRKVTRRAAQVRESIALLEKRMVPRETLIAWLNSIEWLHCARFTPEATELIDDHLEKIRRVINEIVAQNKCSVVDAEGIAQTAGHNTPEGKALLHELFSKVLFRGAGVRTCLIGTIAAAYCWDLDPDLRRFQNPWPPLVELFGMGYTTSGDDDPNGGGLRLLVGLKDGTVSYRII